MSDSATQAHTFFDEVARTRKVWTIRDDGGYPVPRASLGMPARPFWSSLSRVNRILKAVPAYRRFAPEEVSWEAFRDTWVPSLERDGLHVGVNWGGKFATGFDLAPAKVRDGIQWRLDHPEAAV